MTIRMPPWEAERVANVLEYAAMLTATEPKMKPWMKACAERIKEAVKAERERRKRKELLPPSGGKPGKKERRALQWIAKIAEVAG